MGLVFVDQAGLDCAELSLKGAGELYALVVLLRESWLKCEGHVCADGHQVNANLWLQCFEWHIESFMTFMPVLQRASSTA